MDDTLKSLKTQIEPLVNLKQVSHNAFELIENDSSNSFEESFTVVTTAKEKGDIKVKIEMKEETELLDNIEAEFVNQDDGK